MKFPEHGKIYFTYCKLLPVLCAAGLTFHQNTSPVFYYSNHFINQKKQFLYETICNYRCCRSCRRSVSRICKKRS